MKAVVVTKNLFWTIKTRYTFCFSLYRGDQRVDECPICLDPLENADDYICDNGHKFHRHCISSWCSKAEAPSCPTCRNTITLDVAMPAPPQLIITQ